MVRLYCRTVQGGSVSKKSAICDATDSALCGLWPRSLNRFLSEECEAGDCYGRKCKPKPAAVFAGYVDVSSGCVVVLHATPRGRRGLAMVSGAGLQEAVGE